MKSDNHNGNGNGGTGCGGIVLFATPFLLLLASFLLTWYSIARWFKWTGWPYDNIQLPPEVEPFLIPLAIFCAILAVIMWLLSAGKIRIW